MAVPAAADGTSAPSGRIMGDPGPTGRFGGFGGRFVPESLVPACQELEAAFGRPGPTRPSTPSSR